MLNVITKCSEAEMQDLHPEFKRQYASQIQVFRALCDHRPALTWKLIRKILIDKHRCPFYVVGILFKQIPKDQKGDRTNG
jgi:hypothetical protein